MHLLPLDLIALCLAVGAVHGAPMLPWGGGARQGSSHHSGIGSSSWHGHGDMTNPPIEGIDFHRPSPVVIHIIPPIGGRITAEQVPRTSPLYMAPLRHDDRYTERGTTSVIDMLRIRQQPMPGNLRRLSVVPLELPFYGHFAEFVITTYAAYPNLFTVNIRLAENFQQEYTDITRGRTIHELDISAALYVSQFDTAQAHNAPSPAQLLRPIPRNSLTPEMRQTWPVDSRDTDPYLRDFVYYGWTDRPPRLESYYRTYPQVNMFSPLDQYFVISWTLNWADAAKR